VDEAPLASLLALTSLAAGSLCVVVIELDIASGRRQRMAVMNLVWPVLYLDVIGLARCQEYEP